MFESCTPIIKDKSDHPVLPPVYDPSTRLSLCFCRNFFVLYSLCSEVSHWNESRASGDQDRASAEQDLIISPSQTYADTHTHIKPHAVQRHSHTDVYSLMNTPRHATVSKVSQWGTLNVCHEQDTAVHYGFNGDLKKNIWFTFTTAFK